MLRRPVQDQIIERPEACEATPGLRTVLRVYYGCRISVWVPKHGESNAHFAGAAVVVEVVLILDFLICIILRSLDTKRTLMHQDDLEEMDKMLPTVLSTIMLVISVAVPLTILMFNRYLNRRKKREKVGTPGPREVAITWNASQLK